MPPPPHSDRPAPDGFAAADRAELPQVASRLGVHRVINAAGKMTALGGSAQAREVARAQADAAGIHLDIAALRAAIGELIVECTGAEAGSATSGAAAGIAIAVAAVVAGDDPARVTALPATSGQPNRILLLAGHDINFGAPVRQMVSLGGGQPHIVGAPGAAPLALFRAALALPDVAAALFVQSHHCHNEGMPSLPDIIAASHDANVPVIVDAAAESDLRAYIAAGADLVTYSGGKAIGGPTSGFLCGRADLIAACEAQQAGIGRAMKIGKEQLMGLATALTRYCDPAASPTNHDILTDALFDALTAASAGRAQIGRRADEAGRPIERVTIAAPPSTLRALVASLAAGQPSIRTRNHHLANGFIQLDPRELEMHHVAAIASAVASFFAPTENSTP